MESSLSAKKAGFDCFALRAVADSKFLVACMCLLDKFLYVRLKLPYSNLTERVLTEEGYSLTRRAS